MVRPDETALTSNPFTQNSGPSLPLLLEDCPTSAYECILLLPSLSIQNFCKVAIKEAIIHGVFIERACRAQLELCASGLPWTPPAM